MWGRRVFGRVLLDSEVYEAMSRPSRLLKKVRLPSNAPDFAKHISAALKENFAIARSSESPNQFVSVPARDIVILGGMLPDTFATSIGADLTSMHGQFVPDFRVSTAETLAASASGDISVFFGRGVFAASDAPQVADLEFCATIGGAKPSSSTRGVVPCIRAQSGHNAKKAAAWYAGQSGLAIGFALGAAPATILPEELGSGWEQILQDVVLFFGRQNETDPIIRGFHRQRTISDAAAVAAIPIVDSEFSDWHCHDGEWQWLDVGGRKLWFRFTNRTGASWFATNAELVEQRAREAKATAGLIVVKGLILPRMPGLFDAYSGWRVDFQGDETLRHSEVAGKRWTAVAQTRGRYAIFSHGEGQWRGEEKSATGDMLLALGKRRQLELRYLDQLTHGSRYTAARPDAERLENIYQADPLVLMYAEATQSQTGAMGAFLLPVFEGEQRWQRFVAEPATPYRDDNASDSEQQPISLDWVNRAASVDGNVTRGLAEFWLSRWGLEASATPSRLEVRVKLESGVETYRIENNGYGALGPLWVKYVWLD
jgi:hypothetical protein